MLDVLPHHLTRKIIAYSENYAAVIAVSKTIRAAYYSRRPYERRPLKQESDAVQKSHLKRMYRDFTMNVLGESGLYSHIEYPDFVLGMGIVKRNYFRIGRVGGLRELHLRLRHALWIAGSRGNVCVINKLMATCGTKLMRAIETHAVHVSSGAENKAVDEVSLWNHVALGAAFGDHYMLVNDTLPKTSFSQSDFSFFKELIKNAYAGGASDTMRALTSHIISHITSENEKEYTLK